MFEINIEKALKNGTLREKIDNMKREIEQRQEEIKKCEKALEESKKPKLAIPFVPKDKEGFCVYNRYGRVSSGFMLSKDDLERAMLLGAYKTEEEAKLAYEKRCAEMELFMMCDFFETSDRQYFAPLFVNYDKKWIVENVCNCIEAPYRFASKDSCEAAIDKLGDRKLRLIFNIPAEN